MIKRWSDLHSTGTLGPKQMGKNCPEYELQQYGSLNHYVAYRTHNRHIFISLSTLDMIDGGQYYLSSGLFSRQPTGFVVTLTQE